MADPPSRRGRAVRRYGSLVLAAVVAVAVVAVLAFAGGGAGTRGSGRAGSAAGALPLTFAEARTRDLPIDWGPECDPATGRIRLPTVYAPPCVVPPTGPNGGATTPGVSGDTIKVVLYEASPNDLFSSIIRGAGVSDTTEQAVATMQGLADLFGRVFQTYGRRVELVPFTASGTGSDETAARADGIRVATQLRPFAVIGGPTQTSAFGDELTSHGIECLGDCGGPVSSAWVQQRAPYVWPSSALGIGQQLQAEWLGKRVAGGKAVFAGDAAMHDRTRRIALVNYDDATGMFQSNVAAYERTLASYHVALVAHVRYFLDTTKMQDTARTIVAKLQAARATTVVLATDPLTPVYLLREATAQHYYPEWINTGSVLTATDFFGRLYDQQQWAHSFGFVNGPVRVPQDQYDGYRLYQWGFGSPPPARSTAVLLEPPLFQLFTGIQLAGPRLTPASFRDALFSYPSTGGGPTAPTLNWGAPIPGTRWRSFGGQVDGTEIWWDPTSRGPNEIGLDGAGLVRWSDGGRRYRLGQVPTGPTDAFRTAGSVTGFPAPPPPWNPPGYPPPPR